MGDLKRIANARKIDFEYRGGPITLVPKGFTVDVLNTADTLCMVTIVGLTPELLRDLLATYDRGMEGNPPPTRKRASRKPTEPVKA